MKRTTSFLLTIMVFSNFMALGACSDGGISAKDIDVQQYYSVSLAPFVIPDLSLYFENVTEKAVYSANRGTVINRTFSHPLNEVGAFEIEITASERGKSATLRFTLNVLDAIKALPFTPQDSYLSGQEFTLNYKEYFENISGDAEFSANIGEFDGDVYRLMLESGTHTVQITATDRGRNATLTFTLNVEQAPLFTSFNEKARRYARISYDLNKLVEQYYFIHESSYGFHYYPNLNHPNGDNSTAFLWPYTEMVAASWRLITMTDESAELRRYYENALHGFEYYLALRSDHHVYSAVRAIQIGWGSGDTYYDDNIWVSRELLNAYEVLGDEYYLEKSIRTAEYVWSGWANDEIGGIYWKEQSKTSRNACSNAPAVILFSRLYRITGEQKWLDRAMMVYDFVATHLRNEQGLIYDSISNDGKVDTRESWIFTYNCGSMITAGVKLYEITEEQRYLNEAIQTAQSSYDHFFKYNSSRGYRTITSSNPWFNVLLLDGFIELYPHHSGALAYIQAFEDNLNYAYEHHRNDIGFMSKNWVNGGGFDKLNVLDMAGNAENFGQLAYFYQFVHSN